MVKECTVTNKSAGRVVYKVPDMNIRREFRPRETKRGIPLKELEGLAAQAGGRVLLYNYLMVHEEEAIRYLINGEVSPEYWLTEDKIPDFIQNSSLDEFKDALDFAPQGTKDLIKQYAVDLKLNSYDKRQAIKEQLGFDVDEAIKNFGDDDDSNKSTTINTTGKRVRRTQSSITAPTPTQTPITLND